MLYLLYVLMACRYSQPRHKAAYDNRVVPVELDARQIAKRRYTVDTRGPMYAGASTPVVDQPMPTDHIRLTPGAVGHWFPMLRFSRRLPPLARVSSAWQVLRGFSRTSSPRAAQ